MPQFQYQVRAEPVSTAPEATTVDRWLPSFPQPVRAAVSIAALAAGLAAPVLVPSAAAPTPLPQQQVHQPSRTAGRVAATAHAEPVSTAPETVTADRWAATVTQPDRTPRRPTGTTHVAPLVPIVATTGTQYHVYGSPSAGAPIDYSTVLATVAGLTWSTPALTAGVWQFAVRAFDVATGLEESNTDATVTITISASLADISAVPAAPAGLAATATANGSAHVTWCYTNTPGASKPTGFRVYGGTPTVSYASPLATVSAALANLPYAAAPAPLERYSANLTGLTDGATYEIAVRAYNATGEESNTVTVSLTARATPPAAVQFLSAS